MFHKRTGSARSASALDFELEELYQRNQDRLALLSRRHNIALDQVPVILESDRRDTKNYRRQLREAELQLFNKKLEAQATQARFASKLELLDVSKRQAQLSAAGLASQHTLDLLQRIRQIKDYVNEEKTEAIKLYKAKQLREEERKSFLEAKRKLAHLIELSWSFKGTDLMWIKGKIGSFFCPSTFSKII